MRVPAILAVIAAACVDSATASQVVSQNGNDYGVLLTPNDPLEIAFTVTVPAWTELPTDVFLAIEATGSFIGDHVTLRMATPSLTAGLGALNDDVRFGLGTFVDKPVAPFGSPSAGDYEYATNLAITANVAGFQSAVEGIAFFNGSDGPESQLTALLMAARRASGEVGFRDGSRRVAVIATDSDYHKAGDYASAPANNADAVLDGVPPGSGEDYPSVAQVASALDDAGIVPLFWSAGGVEGLFDGLVAQLGRGGSLVLAADASNLVSAIDSALSAIASPVSILALDDDDGLVDQIVADSSGDLLGSETRTFTTTLLWDGFPIDDDSITFDLTFGFGTASISLPEPGPAGAGLAAVAMLAGLHGRALRRRNAS